MIRISYWAKSHVWQSRIIIILCYVVLNVLGIFIGRTLSDINVIIPRVFLTGFIGLVLLLFLFYPEKLKINYYKRKFFDHLLGICTLFFIIFVGNQHVIPFQFSTQTLAFNVIVPKDTVSLQDNQHLKNFKAKIQGLDVSKLTTHQKLKIVRQQIKEIKKDEHLSKTEKILLILLSLLIAYFALGLVGALACSLACSGSEAMAWVVLFTGGFLIIFFLVRTILRILRGPRQRRNQKLKDAAKKEADKKIE